MAAGYHVTSQPVNVTAIRKRAPGTDTAPTAENALTSVSADSQRGRLLLAFYAADDAGLTDDQAARQAEIGDKSCWWKRCGELRRAGLIEPMSAGDDDTIVMREGESGMLRTVSVITPEGRAVAYGLEMMRRIIWTAVLAVLFGLAGVVMAVVVQDNATTALCLALLGITFASLSNREGS